MPTNKTKTKKNATTKKLQPKNLLGIKQNIQSILVWVKTRPARFKYWLKEDRKKKKYRSFRLQKKIKPEPRYIPNVKELLQNSLKFIWQNKKLFFGLALIHLAVYFLIVRTPVQTDIGSIEEVVEVALGSDSQTLQGNVATLGAVLGASSTASQNSSLGLAVLFLISLIYIWAIRQRHQAKQTIKIRDALYQGTQALIPVGLVTMVISLQLIPFAVASFVYTTARTNSLFVSGAEDISFFLVALLLGLLSFYWITATIMAVYIVTLPGMYPMQALRSAKKLVKFQRLTIFRRILSLAILLVLVYALILLLIIRFFSDGAFLAAEVLQILILPVVHVYLYKLYRSLI